jgi:ATP-dependent RNA helicase DeaD
VATVPTIADLRERRMELIRQQLLETIEAAGLEPFRELCDSLVDTCDVVDIAAAAIKRMHDAAWSESDDREIPDASKPHDRSQSHGGGQQGGYQQRGSYGQRSSGGPDLNPRFQQNRGHQGHQGHQGNQGGHSYQGGKTFDQRGPQSSPQSGPPSGPQGGPPSGPRPNRFVEAPWGERSGPGGRPQDRGQDSHRPQSGAGSPEFERIFVGLGRRANIRPGDLFGAVLNETGLPRDAVGSIRVTEAYSLVEVPAGEVDRVIEALRRTTLRGNKVFARRDRGSEDR